MWICWRFASIWFQRGRDAIDRALRIVCQNMPTPPSLCSSASASCAQKAQKYSFSNRYLSISDISQYQILSLSYFFQCQIFFNIRHISLSFIFQYQIFFSIRYLSVSDIFQYQVSFNKISFNIRCLLMSDISQYQISFNITYIAISDILYTAYVYSRTLSL